MNQADIKSIPIHYSSLVAKCKEEGFTMPSDIYIGTLLTTLISSKPKARVLELGTGIGLSLAWMVDGLDDDASIISIDNDPKLIEIAQSFFGEDKRVELLCADGTEWIKNYQGEPFDLIFADAWPGKYSELNETISMIKKGGFYIIDDMTEQPNWPEGHAEKAKKLVSDLEAREDLIITKMVWSTGVMICVKK
ncbi:O-methyltransferase [Fulvivirga ligni]|uniref:O-methyltransferase n=1 Tax=Fulvivirga ligni TaxID=2904246 RepID=UPI001F4112CF|nr:class I SAM-dependent methyltransferase [Fulvivirga ligni]UII23651.1 class I SAM-dependent methyltransferase [Fulvivirga ligni]